MKFIWKFHRWYDGLSELNHFFVFLVLGMTGMTLMAFGGGIFVVIGAIYTGFVVLTRIYYVSFLKSQG